MEKLMHELKYWSMIYELSFQFWPNQNNIWVYKEGVLLFAKGGLSSIEDVILESLEYIRGINPNMYRTYNKQALN